jgi:hypothetical protein
MPPPYRGSRDSADGGPPIASPGNPFGGSTTTGQRVTNPLNVLAQQRAAGAPGGGEPDASSSGDAGMRDVEI